MSCQGMEERGRLDVGFMRVCIVVTGEGLRRGAFHALRYTRAKEGGPGLVGSSGPPQRICTEVNLGRQRAITAASSVLSANVPELLRGRRQGCSSGLPAPRRTASAPPGARTQKRPVQETSGSGGGRISRSSLPPLSLREGGRKTTAPPP